MPYVCVYVYTYGIQWQNTVYRIHAEFGSMVAGCRTYLATYITGATLHNLELLSSAAMQSDLCTKEYPCLLVGKLVQTSELCLELVNHVLGVAEVL